MDLRRNRIVAGVLAGAAVLWLALGVFGVHTKFIDERVSEALPFAVPTADPIIDPKVDRDALDDDHATGESASTTVAKAAPSSSAPGMLVDESMTASAAPAVPVIDTIASGTLVDHAHQGAGTAVVLSDGTETFLRFEDDFAIDNGPDLNVYLVRGVNATDSPDRFDDDFVDLGDLKGNIGAQNYPVPEGVDITQFDTIVIWCVRFGVAFNAADLVLA